MKRTGVPQKPGSRSQRKRKVSERVRSVDTSALREAQRRRLEAFENDNYAAEAEAVALANEPEYNPDEESDEGLIPSAKKPTKRARSSRSSAAGKSKAKVKKGIERWNKPLQLAIDEEDISKRPKNMVHYNDIQAGPSKRPARPFCSVCGYKAAYTCTRCLVRFCSVPCGKLHDETRCMKYTT